VTLRDLGFDSWFETRASEAGRPELRPARVTAVDRGRWLVRDERGEVPAEPSGKLLFAVDSGAELPTVGDWTLAQYHSSDSAAVLHELLPRKTFLRRKAAGKEVEHQMIAANIDTAFLVQSCDLDFNVRRLERYLVMATEGGIGAVVLLTKTDLVEAPEVEKRIEEIRAGGIDAPVVPISNTTGAGLDRLGEVLSPGRTFCMLGSSGVGKTTLLNRLVGQGAFAVKDLRKIGKGKHTTARRQLIVLGGGAMLVDTPGMREVGLLGAGRGIDGSFADVAELAGACRFVDCTHTSEPGCAVLAAVEEGRFERSRYESFLKLKRESDFHERSYVERRKRDKAFGRMVKSVLKRKPS